MPGEPTFDVFSGFAIAVQLGLGIVFLFSAMPKLRHPLSFAKNVIDYEVLPVRIAYAFATLVILVEVFLIVAFLAGWMVELALPLAAAMLTSFMIGGGINLKRGRKVPCGCFGNTNERVSVRTLTRLFLLLAAVLFVGVSLTTANEKTHGLGELIGSGSLVDAMYIAFLVAFLMLLAAWVLKLPELIVLVPRKASRDNAALQSAPNRYDRVN